MSTQQRIFGIHPVREAIEAEKDIDKIYIQQGIENPVINTILKKLEGTSTQIQEVPIEKLNRLTKGNHQGIVADISPIKIREFAEVVEQVLANKPNPLFLVLDQISDVRNFGAIIRSAECTGVDAIIVQKKGGAPISADTVKTSAGAIFNVPICKVDHIKDAVFYFKASGVYTIAAAGKGETTIYETDTKKPLALIMGSEGRGVSHSVLKEVDASASLPLLGQINSLNVSVACGAILYEIVRQRSFSS
ncbi:MAG TPA: 23S rRNA (guanosine(2251)-2'-O)-methyltransferase RlmB [Flavobacteriaceae bacterium]|nr:23S rRNA (guanosine(2251)-2'-O)-methyltransferase RlmB [Flavobacteriaceae bacterium]